MFTKSIKQLSKVDVTIAGGKGASLGEMTQAGIPIPPGFVILSNAFERFLDETNLKVEIDAVLDSVNYKEMHTIEDASEKIHTLVLDEEIPKDIADEIKKSFKKLKAMFVAVRSSATSEDSSTAAWAGQLETYLNTTDGALLENVKRCWASLFTPRAIVYRFEKDLHKKKISVAVVVQKMVQSEVSGVAFSVHPVTQDRNQIIIEASFGLGEAIVSGQVTPDSYVVEKKELQILDKRVEEQTRELVRSKTGGNEWGDIPPERGRQQVLSDKEILELSKLIIKIEKHYNFPVDIEWAREKGKLYLLQSRPITTLTTEPSVTTGPAALIRKKKNWHYYVSRKFNWFVEHTQILSSQKPAQERYLGFSFPTMNYLVLNGDEYYLEDDSGDYSAFLRKKFDQDQAFFDKFAKKEFLIAREIGNYRQSLNKLNLKHVSNKKLSKLIRKFAEYYLESFIPAWVRPDNFLETELKQRLSTELGISDKKAEDIFNRIATYPELGELAYSDEPLSLLRIAKQMKDANLDSAHLPKAVNKRLDQHIKKYSWLKGPVAFEELKFARDEYIERLRFLVSEDADKKIQTIISARKQNEQAYKEAISRHRIRGSLLKLCEAVRKFIFLRTYTTEVSDHLFFTARQTLFKEAAKRLGIAQADIIMLTPNEIIDGLQGKPTGLPEIVADRRLGFAIVWLDGEITTLLGSQALNLQKNIGNQYRASTRAPTPAEEKTTVKGVSAASGKVTGAARVLLSYKDADKVRSGDILVATMTTPDYISAMEKAVAFVTDEGGITCHAAIIAREFGVPCIVGTGNATQVLKDGDLVEVDADKGIVRKLEREKPHIYEKIFTRDFTLAILELWYHAEATNPKVWTDRKQPLMPYIIFERTHETINCYYDPQGIKWIKNELLAKIKKDKNFLHKIEEHFIGHAKELRSIYKKKKTLSRPQLIDLLEKAERFWTWFEAGWWVWEMSPEELKGITLTTSLREAREETQDVIVELEPVIRRSLERSYPELKELVAVLTVDEIRSNKIPSIKELKRRDEGYFFTNNKLYVSVSKSDIEKEFAIVFEKAHIEEDLKEIRGQSAQKGVVRGTVSIVMSPRQINKVNEGDILVAPMTMPDFMPAMTRAAAFVTDEGGIMSHASIMSREMKKPCIIGTKFATQGLKDGDFVEVDADKGIVRILKRRR